MDLVSLIGTGAILLTIVFSIPQVVKVYLSNLPKAISGISIVSMMFGSLAWTLYGYASRISAISTAYLFLFIFSIIILIFMLQKTGVNKKRIAITSTVLGVLLAITLKYFPTEALGYFGGIVSAVLAIPQGFKVIRQREATGVSALMYLFLAVSSSCWVVYGHLTDNLLLILPNLLLIPTSLLVFFNVRKYRAANFWYYRSLTAAQAAK